MVHSARAHVTCARCIHMRDVNTTQSDYQVFPEFSKGCSDIYTDYGPRPPKMRPLASFETSATIIEGTLRHTQLSRHRLLNAQHVLAVSIIISRFCLLRVRKTLGKASGKPRHSQWLHLVRVVGVTVELRPTQCNLYCILRRDPYRAVNTIRRRYKNRPI
jgi:hypothetical protein